MRCAYWVAILFVLAAPPARAEAPDIPESCLYLAPTAGFLRWDSMALGQYEVDADVTPAYGLRVGYAPFEAISGEAVVLLARNEGAVGGGSALVLPEDPAARLTLAEFSFVVNFRTVAAWRVYPFVSLGAGAAVRSSDLEDDGGAVFDDTRLAFHLGGGFKADLSRLVSMRVNIRDTFLTESRSADGREIQNTIDAVELTGTLEYRLPLGRGSGPARLR